MQALETIDQFALGSVTGGAPPAAHRVTPPPPHPPSPANRTTVNTNLGVTARGVQLGFQLGVDDRRTNYASCLATAERVHATPAQITTMCGLPGGS